MSISPAYPFPDAPQLLQLQQSLWAWPQARAAVMVGAGFSLNANPVPGARRRFLTWRELVWRMFEQMHPLPAGASDSERKARADQFNRVNPLRIASEYEVAFDRHKLDALIRDSNPDSDYQPGKLHEQLLRLPWADVFTTNYDTLLEQTQVVGRTYYPVTKAAELVTAFSPRIVKLHGSLPSQTPFIISEEDYRSYPRQFAPFVNTVQQSLLENCFVLLGFSGDDPNFLEWTGWIRDELGDRHAPIYLVGPLSLSHADRSLLARRGVTPIDLAPLVFSLSPADRHAASIEWFLQALTAARPDRPEEWPDAESPAVKSIPGLPAITSLLPDRPVKLGSPNIGSPLDPQKVHELIARWRFEHQTYPGWMVAPESIRGDIWRASESWIGPLVRTKLAWNAADRIVLFGEICWRFEVCMAPLLSDMVPPFDKALDECFTAMTDMAAPAITSSILNASLVEITDAWFSVACTLLRDARESYDKDRWQKIKAKVDQLAARNPRNSDRIAYEGALFQMWNVNRAEAKKLLAHWEPDPRAPLPAMWKAGLLAELDQLGESRALLRSALQEIRKAQRHQGQNIELLSQEGWCSYVLSGVERCLDFTRWAQVREEFAERWHELKAWDCSPWSLRGFFHRALSAPPPTAKEGTEEIRGFDPGQVSRTRHFGGRGIQDFLPAFAYIRLFEQAGIPMRMPHFDLAGDALRNACSWIGPMTEFWSPALLIRAGKTDDIANESFLSRPQVAMLDSKLADRLHLWCLGILESEIQHFNGFDRPGLAAEALFKVVPEVLSRLAIRMKPDELDHAFRLALRLHQIPAIRAHISLHDCCENWFKRLLDAADADLLLRWLPDLIRTPLFETGVNPHLAPGNVWSDPMKHFVPYRVYNVQPASSETNDRIRAATSWLLKRAASESGEARHRALVRLSDVYHAQLMEPKEKTELGRLLWGTRGPNKLPVMPGWSHLGLLHLPTPKGVDVKAAVKDAILNTSAPHLTGTNEHKQTTFAQHWAEHPVIYEAALVSKPVVQVNGESLGTIDWTQREAKTLFGVLLSWWEHDRKGLEAFQGRTGGFTLIGTDAITNTLMRSAQFLIRVVIPRMGSWSSKDWDKLLAYMDQAKSHGISLAKIMPYILLHRPENVELVGRTLKEGLLSNTADIVEAGARAVRHWACLADSHKVPAVNPDVIQLLTERVAFRRRAGITTCLYEITSLVRDLPAQVSAPNIKLLIESLGPWHDATALPVAAGDLGDFGKEERPDLRAFVGALANALASWCRASQPRQSEPAAVAFWRDDCAKSSLPEVRRSFPALKEPGRRRKNRIYKSSSLTKTRGRRKR